MKKFILPVIGGAILSLTIVGYAAANPGQTGKSGVTFGGGVPGGASPGPAQPTRPAQPTK